MTRPPYWFAAKVISFLKSKETTWTLEKIAEKLNINIIFQNRLIITPSLFEIYSLLFELIIFLKFQMS